MKAFATICALLLLAAPAVGQTADLPALAWTNFKQVRNVKNVFSHPSDPAVVFLAATDGLYKSTDGAKTFAAVESASAEKLGLVTALAISPADDKLIAAGTDENGVFLSADGGATWKKLGDEKEKPAHAHVEFLAFSTTDPSFRTLFACHGKSAPGLSLTRDLGKTWSVLADDRHLASLAQDGDIFVASGSLAGSDAEVWGIHRSGFDGLRWEEYNRGSRPGQVALSLMHPARFFYATDNGEVFLADDDARNWESIYKSEGSSWAGMFFAYGRTGMSEVLALYSPHRRGLVLSPDRLAKPDSAAEASKGLYVGPYVKSGAVCRANANGSIYYAAMNNTLYVGRREVPKEGPMVALARCSPGSLWLSVTATRAADAAIQTHIDAIAAGTPTQADVVKLAAAARTVDKGSGKSRFAVQATITHPDGLGAVKKVTADFTAIGGKANVEMFDDGAHFDGQAGDGVYGAEASFSTALFHDDSSDLPPKLPKTPGPPPVHRPMLPGLAGVTVTAADADGKSDSWSAVVSLQRRPEPVSLFPQTNNSEYHAVDAEGPVKVTHDTREITFDAAGRGPWKGTWTMAQAGLNTYGRDFLTFTIKGDTDQEIYVCLIDSSNIGGDMVDIPHYSQRVSLIAGGYLKNITAENQKVRVPMSELLPKGTLFHRRHTAGIAIGVLGNGKAGKYTIDSVQILPE